MTDLRFEAMARCFRAGGDFLDMVRAEKEAKVMSRRLKTFHATWFDTSTNPVSEYSGDVVPARIAQKLVNLLLEVRILVPERYETLERLDAALLEATEDW